MKNHRLLTIIGAGIASLLSSWLPAIAQPVLTYNGASTYKDSKGSIPLFIQAIGDKRFVLFSW